MRWAGSRRRTLAISCRFRMTVFFPSVITSGSGTWNRSPLVRTSGSWARARSRSFW